MTLDGGRGVCNVQLVISMLLASTEPFEATLWAVPSVPGVAPYKIRVTAAPTEVWCAMPLIVIGACTSVTVFSPSCSRSWS